MTPGANWDGTRGSGFATIPSDPARATAKPAARLLVPDHQFFTDTLEVGVMALANNAGTLIGGVSAVRFHFEGGVSEVRQMSFRTQTRYDGSSYQCLGYWCALVKPAGTSGHANLYIEVVPADSAMQSRVLGPYQFSAQDTLYTHDLTVASSQSEITGERYQSVGNALKYLAQQDSENPRITITEAHTEDLTQTAQGGAAHNPQGRCLICATAPVTFAGSEYRGDAESSINFKYRGIHFQGPNITFDMQHINLIRSLGDNEPILERVRFINSAGRGALWRSGIRPTGQMVDGNPWFIGCDFFEVSSITKDASLVLGCTSEDCDDDWGNDVRCLAYNSIVNHDSLEGHLNELNAMTLRYTGSEGTATIEATGNSDQDRTITLRWGANSAVFEASPLESAYNASLADGYNAVTAGSGYFVSDFVTWVNAQSGWTATLLSDDRRLSALNLVGEKVAPIPATDAKSATLTLITIFDIHADFYQQNFSGTEPRENRIICFNQGREWAGQVFHVAGSAEARDLMIVGNAFQMKRVVHPFYSYLVANSNFMRHPFSHVCMVHNTIDAQDLRLGSEDLYAPDERVLIANNALRTIKWTGPADDTGTMIDNVIDAGQTAPQFAEGTVVAGTAASKFTDFTTGDLRPKAGGELATNLKPSRFVYDLTGATRPASAPVGAHTL